MLDFASDSRPVTSLADYVSRASAICEGWKKKRKRDSDWVPWFRGEPDADLATALQPKLYREKDKLKELLYEEQELRLEFWRRGVQLTAEDHPIRQVGTVLLDAALWCPNSALELVRWCLGRALLCAQRNSKKRSRRGPGGLRT